MLVHAAQNDVFYLTIKQFNALNAQIIHVYDPSKYMVLSLGNKCFRYLIRQGYLPIFHH